MQDPQGLPMVHGINSLHAILGSHIRIDRVVLAEVPQGDLRQLLLGLWCVMFKYLCVQIFHSFPELHALVEVFMFLILVGDFLYEAID